ncbi:hypothetical protein ACI8AA_01150 [Geodermatophilus sp. SYSU D01180]
MAIRLNGRLIDFYVNQNLWGEDDLGTRFSFTFEAGATAPAAFLGLFSRQYQATTRRTFVNPDDSEFATLPVLDWSEQISFER